MTNKVQKLQRACLVKPVKVKITILSSVLCLLCKPFHLFSTVVWPTLSLYC